MTNNLKIAAQASVLISLTIAVVALNVSLLVL